MSCGYHFCALVLFDFVCDVDHESEINELLYNYYCLRRSRTSVTYTLFCVVDGSITKNKILFFHFVVIRVACMLHAWRDNSNTAYKVFLCTHPLPPHTRLGADRTYFSMGNGLLFHMTQPTSRSTTRNNCIKQTNQQWTLQQMKMQWRNSWSV